MPVVSPAILKHRNLQRLRPAGVTPINPTEYEGRDIYFFDDLELLPKYWQSTNRDNIGELLIAFFHYYHKEFRYTFDVVSIRSEGGILNKVSKGWMNDQSPIDTTTATATTTSSAAGTATSIDANSVGKDGTNATPGQNRNIPRDLNRLCIEVSLAEISLLAKTLLADTSGDSLIVGSFSNGL